MCASGLCHSLSGILRTGQCGASLESGTHTGKEREGGAEAGDAEGKERASQSRQPVREELSNWKDQVIFAYDS